MPRERKNRIFNKYMEIKGILTPQSPKLLQFVGQTEFVILDAIVHSITYKIGKEFNFKRRDVQNAIEKDFKTKIAPKTISLCLENLEAEGIIRKEPEVTGWIIDAAMVDYVMAFRDVQIGINSTITIKRPKMDKPKEIEKTVSFWITWPPDHFFSHEFIQYLITDFNKEGVFEIASLSKKELIVDYNQFSRFYNMQIKFTAEKEVPHVKKEGIRIDIESIINKTNEYQFNELNPDGKAVTAEGKARISEQIGTFLNAKNPQEALQNCIIKSLFLILIDLLSQFYAFDIVFEKNIFS